MARRHGGWSDVVSITATQILRAMASENAHIAVLRGPTHEYQEYISLSRADGLAVAIKFAGTLSREMLTALVEANFVKRDGPENAHNVTVFKLTDEGRMAANLGPNKKPPPK